MYISIFSSLLSQAMPTKHWMPPTLTLRHDQTAHPQPTHRHEYRAQTPQFDAASPGATRFFPWPLREFKDLRRFVRVPFES